MTDHRVASRAGVMRHVARTTRLRQMAGILRHAKAVALLSSSLLIAGCFNAGGPAGSKLRIYASDLTGAAKVCDVPAVNPVAGQRSETSIKLVNDGGWCGIHLHQDGGKPFEAGLLTARPSRGSVLIHEVGDETRLDYTPDRGFAGTDSFAVKLIPGNAEIRVTVTASAPQK